MSFSDRLRKCRLEKGWTQEDLSKKLNIKRPTYAKYETNENMPDYMTLIKLADLFGVSTDFLLGRIADETFEEFNSDIHLFYVFSELLKELDMNIEDVIKIEKWNDLNREDINVIIEFIDWIAHKAKRREK